MNDHEEWERCATRAKRQKRHTGHSQGPIQSGRRLDASNDEEFLSIHGDQPLRASQKSGYCPASLVLMSPDQEEVRRERDALRKQYGEIFGRMSSVLFEADLMGINFETNTDEYEPEVGTILPRLRSAKSAKDVQRIVHEEFCRWFGPDEAGPVRNYEAVSASLWEVWHGFHREV